ncbi:MAG: hypothetical protein ACRC2T_09655, partial [Thermoguttaceae bacterium]
NFLFFVGKPNDVYFFHGKPPCVENGYYTTTCQNRSIPIVNVYKALEKEVSTNSRTNAIKALTAFAQNGMAEEAITAIFDVMQPKFFDLNNVLQSNIVSACEQMPVDIVLHCLFDAYQKPSSHTFAVEIIKRMHLDSKSSISFFKDTIRINKPLNYQALLTNAESPLSIAEIIKVVLDARVVVDIEECLWSVLDSKHQCPSGESKQAAKYDDSCDDSDYDNDSMSMCFMNATKQKVPKTAETCFDDFIPIIRVIIKKENVKMLRKVFWVLFLCQERPLPFFRCFEYHNCPDRDSYLEPIIRFFRKEKSLTKNSEIKAEITRLIKKSGWFSSWFD